MRFLNKLVVLAIAALLAACEVKPPPIVSEPIPVEPKETLFDAARAGNVALASLLLSKGAAVNAADAEQMTALHYAAFGGHANFIRLLAIQGADVNPRDAYGFTPLHAAARDGHLDAVTALVDAGADLNPRDSGQQTPVQVAAFMQHQAIVDFLYARGAAREPEEIKPEQVAAPKVPDVPTILLTGANFRVWTSASGAQIDAEFVQCVMDVVTLRKRDAQLVRIRLNLLKPVDQVAARQMAGTTLPVLLRQRAARPEKSGFDQSIGARIGEEKGWTVIENCTLLKKSANDGDSFHVMGDGKEYIFRLYYVDAAETDLGFPDRVREQSEYFKLDESDTLRLGSEAARFSEKILSPASFTIVTKWEDARGNSRLPRQYAFVITTQGDLDELLMAEGLVRLYGMRIDGNFGSKKYKELQELERDAKREKAGAWGLGRDVATATKM